MTHNDSGHNGAGKIYGGVDRRSRSERRSGSDRRNLMRFEAIGSERRIRTYRRQEDCFWLGRDHR